LAEFDGCVGAEILSRNPGSKLKRKQCLQLGGKVSFHVRDVTANLSEIFTFLRSETESWHLPLILSVSNSTIDRLGRFISEITYYNV